ncbi:MULTISPECIES: hypothetical protein [unclassified Sphingomonas]|uniref:hypothetical protein n=1 Tax=unclassified Sphingomonas TaxID=196159 RepID=UPI00285435F9|nr:MULTISPECIES: hypothetical protein [unclassified Sphingomonas]MDR6113661.1 hypothetical protein [Sphingomonas sp. SORGH_AS_0789]MDR6148979.1 hypothetical protein [Sphingomonas sp. SORGH_AS_0742]
MLALAFFAFVAADHCRVENARYVLRHQPSVTAAFRPVDSGPEWPAGVAMAIRFGDSGRRLWWLPWNGGTDGRQHLASTTDVTRPGWHPPSPDGGPRPLGDMAYVGTTATYDVIESVPRRGGAAPAHILLPGLGDAAWHGDTGQRDRAATQFFDLVGCAPTARSGSR